MSPGSSDVWAINYQKLLLCRQGGDIIRLRVKVIRETEDEPKTCRNGWRFNFENCRRSCVVERK